jgi:intracellular septation protein
MTDTTEKPQINPLLKLVLDIGPLVLFFVANSKPGLFTPFLSTFLPADLISGERGGIFVATAVFMIAILVALVVSYALTRHLPMMPVVTAVVVVVFGAATLFFHDETFIKLKPTIIYVLFGAVLISGYLLDKPFLQIVFDSVFKLTAEGWRKLTVRWAAFFFVLALLNELVWRTQTTDTWVNFKVFGVTLMTFGFAAMQLPLMQKHAPEEKEKPAP